MYGRMAAVPATARSARRWIDDAAGLTQISGDGPSPYLFTGVNAVGSV